MLMYVAIGRCAFQARLVWTKDFFFQKLGVSRTSVLYVTNTFHTFVTGAIVYVFMANVVGTSEYATCAFTRNWFERLPNPLKNV